MSTPGDTLASTTDAVPPADVPLPSVRELTFGYRDDGGYDHDQVDAFLDSLAVAIDAAQAETAALRTEIARLNAERAELVNTEIAAEAVGVLSQAQLIAEKAITDAEQYARDVVLSARSQYRAVLERAEATASSNEQTANGDGAMTGAPGAPDVSLAELAGAVPEIEYVRTFARVAQVQLHAVLDALSEQVDRLAKLSGPDGAVDGAFGSNGRTAAAHDARSADADDETDAPEHVGDARVTGIVDGEPDWTPRRRAISST